MEIKLYDKVLLNTEETAYIVEILKQGADYIADIDRIDGSTDTEFLTQDKIQKVLK